MDHSGSLPVIHKIAPNAEIYASAGAGVNELRAHFGIEATPVKTGDTLCIGERTLSFVTTPMVHWPDNMVTYSDVDKILFSNDAFGQHFATTKRFDDENDTLSFVTTPMVHWPDNMVTYSDVDKILFSNDAFGQHFATTKRFDDENDLCEVIKQAKKYYANIVLPYGMQAGRALAAVKGLDLKMIAPSHGCIWRSHIEDILAKYEAWTANQTEEKAVVVFDSMWHSTEAMAREICDAFIAEDIPAQLVDVKHTHISDIMLYMCDAKYVAVGSPTLNSNMLPTVASFLTYMRGLSPKNEHRHISDIMLYMCDAKYVAVGSPTLNSNMLPTVASFLTYMRGLSPKNEHRIGLAFGSYGWAPLGPKQVYAELENAKFQLPVPVVTQQWVPSAENLAELQDTVRKMIEAARA